MTEANKIRAAMLRLSNIGDIHYIYDPDGKIFGYGPIHFLIELEKQFFLAWHNNESNAMIVNPITRYELDELEELGCEEAWTVLYVPPALPAPIQFREINTFELCRMYRIMEEETIATSPLPIL